MSTITHHNLPQFIKISTHDERHKSKRYGKMTAVGYINVNSIVKISFTVDDDSTSSTNDYDGKPGNLFVHLSDGCIYNIHPGPSRDLIHKLMGY